MSDSVTPWTVAHQAPLSIVLTRQEYWSRLPFAPPWDLLDSGIFCIGEDYLPQSHMGSWWLPNLFSSVQSLSRVWLFTPWTAHARLPRPSLSPGVCSSSCPLSGYCHPTILSSVVPFSSQLQSFPASGSFPMSQLFTSGGQRIGASASALPMNTQGWFPLGLTGLISLLSKGLLRVFSSTTVWKYQFFGTQPSL